jgi:cysteinyl-tRNA synthetase
MCVLQASEKRDKNDFALWKASKSGEPFWDSPWGAGRPGWHIECSAMAGETLGSRIDLHGGGEDLAFPHHDNELAQAEAAFGCGQWVNYFLHAGHLHINGLKMSKSLKNFVTIRQALARASARQLRLLFLARLWPNVINYSEDALLEAATKEKTLETFFGTVQAAVAGAALGGAERWAARDQELSAVLQATQTAVDGAVARAWLLLITICRIPAGQLQHARCPAGAPGSGGTHKQVHRRYSAGAAPRSPAAPRGGLRRPHPACVGRLAGAAPEVAERSDALQENELSFHAGAGGSDETTDKVVGVLAAFRRDVRGATKEKKDAAAMYALCDAVRDEGMLPLGYRLEDEGLVPFRKAPAELLLREKEEKAAHAREAATSKLRQRLSTYEAQLAKLQEEALSPAAMFSRDYILDAAGLPSKTLAGADLAPADRKKLEKAHAAQTKKHAGYLEKLGKNPSLLADLEREVAALRTQLAEPNKP